MDQGYTFGDTELAARRLALVAEVFAEPSRRLLVRSIPQGAGVVVDVGCGPGHSTRLIGEACSPVRLLGLDESEAFVHLARRLGSGSSIQFHVHDVTSVPLPGAPADAIYARLVLAHLPDPLGVVERWRSQLRPGGLLVLDELQAIDAPKGPLRDYLGLVEQVVGGRGGALYAGPLLAALGGDVVEVTVDAAVAARLYAMNLPGWSRTARDRHLADEVQLDRLAAALGDLAGRPGTAGVRWRLYQLVLTG